MRPSPEKGVSEAVTRGIRVRVESRYVAERSAPREAYYFFAYHIRISNESDERVQLVSRRWTITDADGHAEEVHGPGVVGEQPLLAPGESFEYTSFCPLPTPIGSMHGTYQMVPDGGARFDAEIAPFSLAVPTALN
jgi:ApaG protein